MDASDQHLHSGAERDGCWGSAAGRYHSHPGPLFLLVSLETPLQIGQIFVS